jgi:hypothetical protein
MDCQSVLSSSTSSQTYTYWQTPDSDFCSTFQQAYDQLEEQVSSSSSTSSDTTVSESSVQNVLGAIQTQEAQAYGISTSDQLEYAKILNEAYSSGAMSDPQKFLESLSSSDLKIVQEMHSLADTINPSSLTTEGATNLLLPEGYCEDLNNDETYDVGVAKMTYFPPPDAPEEFLEAWSQCMSDYDGDSSACSLSLMDSFYGVDESGNTVAMMSTSSLDSYKTAVSDYLSMLDNFKGSLADGQYARDYPFYSHLQDLLQSAE